MSARWRPVLGPLLLASALATGIVAPPAWGQTPPDLSPDPVFFVHGYGDNASAWDTLITSLVDQYRYPQEFLRAITLQPTPYTESNITAATDQIAPAIEAFLTDVNAYLDSVQYPGPRKTRVDLVGHSMGGLSTRWYVAQVAGGAERVDSWIALAGANHGTDYPDLCTDPTVAARELCPAFIEAEAKPEDTVQLTLNGRRAPNRDVDETPYGLGPDSPDLPPSQRVNPDGTRRVFYATIRCDPASDAVIVPNDSTVVDGAGGRPITLPAGFVEDPPASGNYRMTDPLANCHENIHEDPGVAELVALLLRTTTVNFDTPAPPHGPGALDGVFEGIDFGTGQWAWRGPFDVDPTNSIYFNNSTGTSQTFQFFPAPRVLTSMRVFSATTPGTLTLSDDLGQTLTQAVTTGSMQLVTTGWTGQSTAVTVSFTTGWDLGIDDITSR